MADGRLKAVADDDGGDDDQIGRDGNQIGRSDDSDDSEEFDELELGLSLGRWGWKDRNMNGRQMEEERREFAAFRWKQGVGSSRQAIHRPVAFARPFNHWEEDMTRVTFAPPLGDTGLQSEVFLGLERGGYDEDRDMDTHNKRAKVFTSMEASSSMAAEMDIQSAPVDHIDQISSVSSTNEMDNYLNLFSYDGAVVTNDSRSILGINEDIPNTRNNEDTEIHMDFLHDLLHLIFSFLGQKDLCRAGAACKQWLAASTHEDFWRCLKFENTRVSIQNFAAICHRYPNATEVKMFGILQIDLLVMEAMSSLRHLETLNLWKGQFGEGFFHALTDCPALVSLRICDAHLGNGVQEIIVNHEKLRDIHIAKCRALRISVRCPQLQKLSLKRTSMAHASLTCPQLIDLDLSSCHKLSDTAIRHAATACPLLSVLDISSCSCVSDETVREISLACPSLSVLDASLCPNVSFESVRLPMLTNLQLQSCEAITSASITAISHSRLLEALHLYNCGLLTSISLDLPHLRSINLEYLRKFVDLNLRSPVLQSVTVSRCMALSHISITSNALQKLVLQKQESLSTLSLQCHNLQEVDLSDCDSLTNSICGVFSDAGGCPMLRSLVLDNCEKLSVVSLNSSSLIRLSLAGCRALTSLELSCPNLEEMYLDGCDHLEKASFCPVGLESLNLGICPKLSVLRIEAPKMSILELKGCGVLSQAYICCPRLLSLDASFCRQLLDESLSTVAASCPHIEYLVLSSCLSIGFDGLCSLHWLQQLTLLDLSYTFLTNLQPVFDTCSQLVTLKLSACKYLTDSSLDALYEKGALPALNELDLSYSSIGQYSIAKLLAYCTNLVHVNLNGCANMHELVWGSSDSHASAIMVDNFLFNSNPMEEKIACLWKSRHLLEILNCTGCPNIRRVHIPSKANCMHLSKLNLNLSANLKEVDMTCINLGTLNLSYCSSLEILKLDCPRLVNLQLQACIMLEEEQLEAAILQCKMLEILNIHSCPKLYSDDYERLRFICPSLRRIQSGSSI